MKTNEQVIAEFFKPPPVGAYTDEKLAALLAHAEDGKLAFHSCCCLVGIPTAEHPLRSYQPMFMWHVEDTEQTRLVEAAFLDLASAEDYERDLDGDTVRRAKLIPLIRAEFERRERLRAQVEVSEVVMV